MRLLQNQSRSICPENIVAVYYAFAAQYHATWNFSIFSRKIN